MLTLDLALITYGADGISRVEAMNLPVIPDVRYVVSWQNSKDIPVPDSLIRPDIIILRTDTHGAANNRNNAVSHCTADLILFADDDLIYTSEQFQQVIRVFESNPGVDLATFMGTHPTPPTYPSTVCRLKEPLPKGYWVSAYLIAYRRRAVGDLLCHPEFGAGAPFFTGADDELFLLSAIRRGLDCRFFPVNICTHPQDSTGTHARISDGTLHAVGCYLAIAYKNHWPRICLKALRISRSGQANLFRALKHISIGALAAPRILKKSDRRYLW